MVIWWRTLVVDDHCVESKQFWSEQKLNWFDEDDAVFEKEGAVLTMSVLQISKMVLTIQIHSLIDKSPFHISSMFVHHLHNLLPTVFHLVFNGICFEPQTFLIKALHNVLNIIKHPIRKKHNILKITRHSTCKDEDFIYNTQSDVIFYWWLGLSVGRAMTEKDSIIMVRGRVSWNHFNAIVTLMACWAMGQNSAGWSRVAHHAKQRFVST